MEMCAIDYVNNGVCKDLHLLRPQGFSKDIVIFESKTRVVFFSV